MKVIAHCMHEQELAAADQGLQNPITTESFVIGDATEQQIEALQSQGIIVQRLGAVLKDEVALKPRPKSDSVRRASERMAGSLLRDAEDTAHYFVTIEGPLLREWRDKLAANGAVPRELVQGKGYIVRLTTEQANAVAGLEFVQSVQPYDTDETVYESRSADEAPRMASDAPGAPQVAAQMVPYDILLHDGAKPDAVLDWLKGKQVPVAGSSGRKIRVFLMDGPDMSAEIGALPDVARIGEYVEPKLHNDFARKRLGIDGNPASLSLNGVALTGAGQVVGVADTGIDLTHPDFAPARIVGTVDRGRPGKTDDPSGHGTHVAGSVLGDGTASGGAVKGSAPGARLFFQSLLDRNDGLGGLPLSLADLFDEAYMAGARIHNNSWGSATNSMYTINSDEVDDYVNSHPDMLIVISAGNEGIAANNIKAGPGFVDWLSIGSPASAKNALTVGASRTDRNTGPGGVSTWSSWWPDDFPNVPISGELIAGDPECLAAFSSRGPCDDYRMKPDLVAPGTDIFSCRSSIAPTRNFWGLDAARPRYAFMGGTSMSAPLVSGCAALVREYYTQHRQHQPSAALLKATLINGTRVLAGADSCADYDGQPNYHQGFGCVYLPTTVPNDGRPGLDLEFVDSNSVANGRFQDSGQRFRFRLRVNCSTVPQNQRQPLRICLAYTDPPGRGVQNNLNLLVEAPGIDPATGRPRKHIGNEMVPPFGAPMPDPNNNVEIVRIDNPVDGNYLIQISATNILKPNQDFALVVTGNLDGTLDPV